MRPSRGGRSTGAVNVVHLEGQVAEIAADRVRLGLIPVVGEFDFCPVARRARAEEDEREATLGRVLAAEFLQTELVAKESERSG
jgi:hypothetical protein